MPFPTRSVGLSLTPSSADISVRKILAYAAGLGASEPVFLNDDRPGGVLALPFQCVSLEWPVLVSMRSTLVDVLTPAEAARGVHAIQDSEFHRPIRPGDRLVTEGRLVSVRAIRAGVICVFQLSTRDAETGAPVTTSWSSSIYRGVDLEGPEQVLAEPPPAPVDMAGALPLDARETVIPIPREAPITYTECADIWNPIHTERAVALAAGLPDIILHGTATWAHAGLTVLREYAGGDVARLKRISGRFTGMVIPGAPITVRHARIGDAVRFEVLTSDGAPALSQGYALLA
jgi:acyl dehydratase